MTRVGGHGPLPPHRTRDLPPQLNPSIAARLRDANMIHAAGIDSPGIAGSPAIALEVMDLLKKAGFDAPADPNFNPKRAPIIFPKDGEEASLYGKLVYTPDDKEEVNAANAAAHENVVCKCEKVMDAGI